MSRPSKNSRLKNFLKLALLAGVIFLFINYPESCFSQIKTIGVRGGSMQGIFNNLDLIKVNYGYYNCHKVQRGDFVILNISSKGDELVKIVKAIPGDTWGLEKQTDGNFTVRVGGQLLRNSYGVLYSFSEPRSRMLRAYEKNFGGRIPEKTILVFGNQSSGSFDSSVFGLTGFGSLRGKVLEKLP